MQLLTLFLAFGTLSFVLCHLLVRYSHRVRAMAEHEVTGQVRWASQSKPLVGGVAMFISFIIAALYYYVAHDTQASGESSPEMLPILSVSILGFLIGLADDAYNTRPLLKFLGQVFTGVLLVAFGVQIDLFGIWALDSLLTIVWVVGIMNSINMLDNMDGVTGSISASILAVVLVVMQYHGHTDSAAFLMLLATFGAIVGFLVLNWRPAKLYMGDTGSQFLGALLAYVGIVYFWNLVPNSGDPTIFSRQVIFALLAFLMPILDTTFVTVARLSRGQSPAVGGRDHTTHHLAYLGIPQGLIPLIYISITLLSGLLINSILRVLDGWSHFHTLLYGGFVLGVFGLFVFLYRKGGADQREREAKALAATESASLPKTPQPAASEKAQVAVQR